MGSAVKNEKAALAFRNELFHPSYTNATLDKAAKMSHLVQDRRNLYRSRRFYSVDGNVPLIVQQCTKRLRSRFYSVDVAQRIDGQSRVVEVGDGQVSDLVGWSPEAFAKVLQHYFRPGSGIGKNA